MSNPARAVEEARISRLRKNVDAAEPPHGSAAWREWAWQRVGFMLDLGDARSFWIPARDMMDGIANDSREHPEIRRSARLAAKYLTKVIDAAIEGTAANQRRRERP